MNEELQSSNEELETSKEELQSLNEELLNVNNQLHAKVEELERANNDLGNLLASAELATIFLDGELRIKRFTEASAKVFNLRPNDVGRPLADVALKLTDDRLLPDAEEVLDQLAPIQREVSTGDGQWYERRIRPYRTRDNRIEGVVITFTDITDLKRVQSELEDANLRLQGAVERRTSMIVLLHDVAAEANRAASIDEAIAQILPRLGSHLGASWGQVWLVGEGAEDALLPEGASWRREEGRWDELDELTPSRRQLDGQPVTGRVMTSGEAQWCEDLAGALGRERAEAAREAGIRQALLLPVLVRDSAVGVVELLLEPTEERRQHMAELATSLGTEIGRVVERVGMQKKLSDLTAAEQRRLGQELHDTVAQEVAGIRMLADVLRRKIEEGRAEPSDAEELLESATRAGKHVRSIARGLVPVAVGSGGLRSALEQLAERVRTQSGVPCTVRGFRGVVVEDSELATNLYYIAQEAVRNAEQHGEPGSLVVEVEAGPAAFVLRVTDDGRGFDRKDARSASGSGLRIMEYRARLVGAQLDVDSEPGRGTTVTCTVRRRPWGRGRSARPWRLDSDDE